MIQISFIIKKSHKRGEVLVIDEAEIIDVSIVNPHYYQLLFFLFQMS